MLGGPPTIPVFPPIVAAAAPHPAAAERPAGTPADPEISGNRSLAFTPARLPPSPSPGASAEPRERPGKGERGQGRRGRESRLQPCGCGRPFGGTKAGTGPAPAHRARPAAASRRHGPKVRSPAQTTDPPKKKNPRTPAVFVFVFVLAFLSANALFESVQYLPPFAHCVFSSRFFPYGAHPTPPPSK